MGLLNIYIPGAHPICSITVNSRGFCSRFLMLYWNGRFTSHGKVSVIRKSTSSMEQHSTRLTATTFPDVVIGNPAELERKKQAIKTAGLSTLQVIADFDMTLTKYFVNGVRGQSKLLRECEDSSPSTEKSFLSYTPASSGRSFYWLWS